MLNFALTTTRPLAREALTFVIKQARASLFGGFLLAVMLATHWWYPLTSIHRYDFIFFAAVLFQLFLLAFRLETPREAALILVFHVLATIMELFKTSTAIGSWHYPEPFNIGIANVPLFAGFMYSAVGSYLARVWRILDFRYAEYPHIRWTWLLVAGIYINFFSHHFVPDMRWVLLAASLLLYGRTVIWFTIDRQWRRMPLLLGWSLVALFIWLAENLSTYANVWMYPSQHAGWQAVPMSKLVSWYLLMMLSFVLVSHRQVRLPPDINRRLA